MMRNAFHDPIPGDVFISVRRRSKRVITYITSIEPRRVHYRIEHPYGVRHEFSYLSDWGNLCAAQRLQYTTPKGEVITCPSLRRKTNRDPRKRPAVGDVTYDDKSGVIRTVTKVYMDATNRPVFLDFVIQDAKGAERKYTKRAISSWVEYCFRYNVKIVQRGKNG